MNCISGRCRGCSPLASMIERYPIKHDMLSAARRYRYVLLVALRAPERDPRTPTSVLRAVSVPVSCVAPRSRL